VLVPLADVFAPSPDDIEETHGRWIEREPGIGSVRPGRRARCLTLDVRGHAVETLRRVASTAEWPGLRRAATSKSTPATVGSTVVRTPAARIGPARAATVTV
jgi:hypothetical protein